MVLMYEYSIEWRNPRQGRQTAGESGGCGCGGRIKDRAATLTCSRKRTGGMKGGRRIGNGREKGTFIGEALLSSHLLGS